MTKDELIAENKRLEKWVNDLQSGMYINCVYCGHRYGPKDKVACSMQDVLKQHIEKCPKHPLSAARQQIATLKAESVCFICGGTGQPSTDGRPCACNGSGKAQDALMYALEQIANLREKLGNLCTEINAVRKDIGTKYPALAEAWMIAQAALKKGE